MVMVWMGLISFGRVELVVICYGGKVRCGRLGWGRKGWATMLPSYLAWHMVGESPHHGRFA